MNCYPTMFTSSTVPVNPHSPPSVDSLFSSMGNGFPIDVIEIEADSYSNQSKIDMCVVSAEKGNYAGPKKCCPHRWEHILCWHLILPGREQLKLVDSLSRPHCSINREEAQVLIPELMQHNRSKKKKKVFIHPPTCNYQCGQLTVINNFTPSLVELVASRNSMEVVSMIRTQGHGDPNRKNFYVDGGFSGHKNVTERDESGIVKPRLLKHTNNPMMLRMFCWLTKFVQVACRDAGMEPVFKQADGSTSSWAQSIHPENHMEALLVPWNHLTRCTKTPTMELETLLGLRFTMSTKTMDWDTRNALLR